MMMSYEYVYTPKDIDGSLFCIRDGKDYPVLYTAIIEDVEQRDSKGFKKF